MAPLEFYQTFKEEKYQFYTDLQKIEEEVFPNLLYKASFILIQKPDKDILRKENCRQRYKNSRQTSSKSISNNIKTT